MTKESLIFLDRFTEWEDTDNILSGDKWSLEDGSGSVVKSSGGATLTFTDADALFKLSNFYIPDCKRIFRNGGIEIKFRFTSPDSTLKITYNRPPLVKNSDCPGNDASMISILPDGSDYKIVVCMANPIGANFKFTAHTFPQDTEKHTLKLSVEGERAGTLYFDNALVDITELPPLSVRDFYKYFGDRFTLGADFNLYFESIYFFNGNAGEEVEIEYISTTYPQQGLGYYSYQIVDNLAGSASDINDNQDMVTLPDGSFITHLDDRLERITKESGTGAEDIVLNSNCCFFHPEKGNPDTLGGDSISKIMIICYRIETSPDISYFIRYNTFVEAVESSFSVLGRLNSMFAGYQGNVFILTDNNNDEYYLYQYDPAGIISIGTFTAPLAGALNRRVRGISPFDPDIDSTGTFEYYFLQGDGTQVELIKIDGNTEAPYNITFTSVLSLASTGSPLVGPAGNLRYSPNSILYDKSEKFDTTAGTGKIFYSLLVSSTYRFYSLQGGDISHVEEYDTGLGSAPQILPSQAYSYPEPASSVLSPPEGQSIDYREKLINDRGDKEIAYYVDTKDNFFTKRISVEDSLPAPVTIGPTGTFIIYDAGTIQTYFYKRDETISNTILRAEVETWATEKPSSCDFTINPSQNSLFPPALDIEFYDTIGNLAFKGRIDNPESIQDEGRIINHCAGYDLELESIFNLGESTGLSSQFLTTMLQNLRFLYPDDIEDTTLTYTRKIKTPVTRFIRDIRFLERYLFAVQPDASVIFKPHDDLEKTGLAWRYPHPRVKVLYSLSLDLGITESEVWGKKNALGQVYSLYEGDPDFAFKKGPRKIIRKPSWLLNKSEADLYAENRYKIYANEESGERNKTSFALCLVEGFGYIPLGKTIDFSWNDGINDLPQGDYIIMGYEPLHLRQGQAYVWLINNVLTEEEFKDGLKERGRDEDLVAEFEDTDNIAPSDGTLMDQQPINNVIEAPPGGRGPKIVIKTTNPLNSDDNTEGFKEGDLWINTSNFRVYFCLDATTGSAVWRYTTTLI